MQKCARCNRDRLPTAEYTVRTVDTATGEMHKKDLTSRLCNACVALTIAAHGAENVTKIRGSGDEGIPAEVAAVMEATAEEVPVSEE